MKKKWTGERWETEVNNETALEHLHRYALACELAGGKNVLDIACGEGYGSRLLAKDAASVTGVDIDEATINKAKEKYKAPNLRFVTANALSSNLPPHSFDLVVSFETLEHLEEQDHLLEEFKKLLKPNGILIISTPDKVQYSDKTGYKNPYHKKELTRLEFENLIRAQYRNCQFLSQASYHSSVISSTGITGFDSYAGDHQRLEKNIMTDALYLIAIASDEFLPPVNNSIFNGTSILQAGLQAQADEFRKTMSYRLGHLLLTPARWLRNMIKH